MGTLNILEAIREHGIDRFINASFSSVYGNPEYLPSDEEHPNEPVSPYGASKLAAEHYTRIYNEVHDLPTVSLRYFTVYGPRMGPNMAISNFISRCINGKPPVVYGDGSQTQDFTYINDVVDANLQLLSKSSADGEAMNIGSTDNIDILSLAEPVRDEIDSSLEIEFADRHQSDAEHTRGYLKSERTHRI